MHKLALAAAVAAFCATPALAADNAHYRADLSSLPTELGCGDSFPAVIAMENTGTSTWVSTGPAAGYKLGELSTNFDPTRLYLRPGESIAPDTSTTTSIKYWRFTVTPTVATAGTKTLSYQMIYETGAPGDAFFGEVATSSVLVHASPRYLAVRPLPPSGPGTYIFEEVTDTGGLPSYTTQAELRWAAVPCATGYKLEVFATPAPPADPGNTCTPSTGAYYCRTPGTSATSQVINVSAGTQYTFKLTASDSTGSYAATRAFFVQSTTAETSYPSAAPSSPASGSTVSGVVPITLIGSTYQDPFGQGVLDAVGITRMRYEVDGAVLSDLTSAYGQYFHPPWIYLWDTSTLSDGAHTITATLWNRGGFGMLRSWSVNVSNNPSSACLAAGSSTGDDATIQAALSGAGARAVLCPDATYYLKNPVNLTAADQEIFTKGNPTGAHRAKLVVSGAGQANAIKGFAASRARIHHLIIDGNLGTGASLVGDALVELGGASVDQVVDHVKLSDPRSWSSLHFIEGAATECARAVVTNNEVGPAGYSSTDSSGNGRWADGISLDCRDSYVVGNTVTDATDGGIVIFASPRSLVQGNSVKNVSRIAFGGINMVDFIQYRGDYHGTRVTGNAIEAQTLGGIQGAISQGAQFGCPGTSWLNFGASITSNTITGPSLGYGMPVNGVFDWLVQGNTDTGTHSGTPASCGGSSHAAATFLKNSPWSDGTFQSEFAEGVVSIPAVSFGRGDAVLTSTSGVSGLSGAAGAWVYSSFSVPPGSASLRVAMSGGSGDGDLYVKQGGAPTENDFTCRPYLYGNNETCDVQSPQPGIWYAGVRAYSTYSGASLALSFGSALAAGTPLAGIAGTGGSQHVYSLAIPSGWHYVSTSINGGFGDADLYVKVNATASPWSYDCASVAVGTRDSCNLWIYGPASASIDVYGYTEYAGATLATSVQ